MASTNSLNFPCMFNVSQNTVSVIEDGPSVVNRTRLMMLTEPTELYNNPSFGLGLKKHLWKYNTENEKAIIKDRLVEQLSINEPCVVAQKTEIIDGLLFTGGDPSLQEYNHLKLTVALVTTFGDTLEVGLDGDIK